jgi:energy-coupling factor transport system permease protein
LQDKFITMMTGIAPLPKLLIMLLVLTAAITIKQTSLLLLLVLFELLLIIQIMPREQAKGIILGMGACALFVGGLQILFLPWQEVQLIVYRMLAMSLIFPPLLATMRMRDLRDTLVYQLHIPYDYAFMFTTALRYVPDLLKDAQYIMEAQSCRGCDFKQGNPWQRLKKYTSILAPLVMHGLNRAETLAMSMELRGYNGTQAGAAKPLSNIDWITMTGATTLVAALIFAGR